MDFIKEMQQTKETALNRVVDLMIKGVEAQYISRKEGHDAWRKKCMDWDYIGFSFGGTNSNEIQRHPGAKDINIRDNMSEIERRVNTKLGVKAIEYRVDRLNHYFKLML